MTTEILKYAVCFCVNLAYTKTTETAIRINNGQPQVSSCPLWNCSVRSNNDERVAKHSFLDLLDR
jgi:hypothetical protein